MSICSLFRTNPSSYSLLSTPVVILVLIRLYYVIRVSMGDDRKRNRLSMGDELKLGAGRLSNVIDTFSDGNGCLFIRYANENSQHLLTNCVFAHQFWFQILSPLGLQIACLAASRHPLRVLRNGGEKWWKRRRRKMEGAEFTHHPCNLDVTETLVSLMVWWSRVRTSSPSTERSKKSIVNLWCIASVPLAFVTVTSLIKLASLVLFGPDSVFILF